jgi:hypothetical protein
MEREVRKYLIIEIILIMFVSVLIYFKPPTGNVISCISYEGKNCSLTSSGCCPGLICLNGQCAINYNQTYFNCTSNASVSANRSQNKTQAFNCNISNSNATLFAIQNATNHSYIKNKTGKDFE